MAKHTIIVKRPDEEPEIVEFEGQYRCDLKTLIGENDIILDYVQLGRSGDRCFAMACDQEGLFKDLPLNFHLITQSGRHKFYSSIVGTAVFFCYQYEDVWEKEIWDFQLLDLDQPQINEIRHILSVSYQKKLQAAKDNDSSIHCNEVIVTRFQPVLLMHLSFFFVVYGFPGQNMKFCTQPNCTEEYELTVYKAKGKQEIIICRDMTIAWEIKFPIPALATSDKSRQGEVLEQRVGKIQEFRRLLTSAGIPDTVYLTEGNGDILKREIRAFEQMCLSSRENYTSYITIMHDFDSATLDRIRKILKIAVNLYSPSKKRQYIERELAGILSPEEIAKIDIEHWN